MKKFLFVSALIALAVIAAANGWPGAEKEKIEALAGTMTVHIPAWTPSRTEIRFDGDRKVIVRSTEVVLLKIRNTGPTEQWIRCTTAALEPTHMDMGVPAVGETPLIHPGTGDLSIALISREKAEVSPPY